MVGDVALHGLRLLEVGCGPSNTVECCVEYEWSIKLSLRAFAELRRVNTGQHLSAGLGSGCAIGLASPTPPQATREHFENHPKRDREIEPTNDGHTGRARGHPWGAFGLLCCKDTKARRVIDKKREEHK